MRQVVEGFVFLSILPWGTDMPRSIPDLSVSLSFSSSPVTHCWAVGELLAVTDTLRSLGPRLLGYNRFARYVFHNQYRSPKLAPASSVFSFEGFPDPPTCSAALLFSDRLHVLSGASSRVLRLSAWSVIVHVCSGSGARFCMRSLPLQLYVVSSCLLGHELVSWDNFLPDLQWWSDISHLQAGVLYIIVIWACGVNPSSLVL